MNVAYAITGTDTGVGKTWVTCALVRAFQTLGYSTLALKPMASGTLPHLPGINEDALKLQRVSDQQPSYSTVNPWVFEPTIAPHLAADQAGQALAVKPIAQHIQRCRRRYPHCITLVEGVGGWEVPLNTTERFSDLVGYLELPVLLVVDLRLGCLNHTLLTMERLFDTGIKVHGWVANRTTNDPTHPALINTLTNLFPAVPRLTTLPYQAVGNGWFRPDDLHSLARGACPLHRL